MVCLLQEVKLFIVTSSGRAVIYTIGNDGSVTKASTDIDLTNPNTDLFEVVTELPTENIFYIKALLCTFFQKVGEENKYTEYAYIKTDRWSICLGKDG